MSENKELMVQSEATINLPALTNQEEVMEVIQANLQGITGLQIDKVKIPSGGGISFEIIDESGEPTPVKELRGVILDHYPINAWWHDEYGGDKNPPTCSSMDCVTGTGAPEHGIPAGQACATCPKNQWCSDPRGGRGKACKNMIRIYLVPEDSVFPVLIALPPTSRKNWVQYIQRLTNKMKPFYGVVTSVKLEKDKNTDGIEFSKVTFAKQADLQPTEKAAIKDYIGKVRDAMRSQAIDSTEYNTDPAETTETADSGDQPY